VLKKAGIIVAAAATGLLAVSSFAFADETITKDNLTSNCSETQTTGAISSSVSGGNAAVGLVNAAVGLIAPVTAQAPVLNCNNIGIKDVLDFNSNNPTKTVTKTKVKDSFND
jgi:hypothetical protein